MSENGKHLESDEKLDMIGQFISIRNFVP